MSSLFRTPERQQQLRDADDRTPPRVWRRTRQISGFCKRTLLARHSNSQKEGSPRLGILGPRGEVAERLNVLAWKASKRDERFEGSNPSLSARIGILPNPGYLQASSKVKTRANDAVNPPSILFL